MAALLASLLALFVLASAAEAAICAPEALSAHAAGTVADASPEPDDSGRPDQHAICGHGHCHHTGAARADVPDEIAMQIYARPVHAFPSSDSPSSISPDGLKRPPRA